MGTYVISDIHGCYDMFLQMLEKIEFDETKDTLYILGDIMDRGPQIPEMVRWVWEHESEHVIMIRGNHEQMFAEYPDRDYYHFYFSRFAPYEIDHLVDWIFKLPLYKEVNVNGIDYVLVHAGITQKVLYGWVNKKEAEDICLWTRAEFYLGEGIPDKIIVFGHTPMMTKLIDNEMLSHIWHSPNGRMIGIDTGAVFSKKMGGNLSCLRLEDQKEFYVYA